MKVLSVSKAAPAMVIVLVAFALALTACDGGAAPTIPAQPGAQAATAVAPVVAPVPTPIAVSGKSGGSSAATATSAPGDKQPAVRADCAAADEAYQEFAVSSQLIISLRSDQAYAGLINNPGGFNLDTAALRGNLAVIAKLPDAVNDSGDKTSAIIATTRQVLDLIDSNAKSGKPFTDGSGNGQKVLDICGCRWL